MTLEPVSGEKPQGEPNKRDLTHKRWRIAGIITYALFLVILVPWTFQPHTVLLDTLFWTAFTVSLVVGFIAEVLPDRNTRPE